MSDGRRCAYVHCDEPMTGRDARARFHDPKCRAAQWKLDRGYGHHDATSARERAADVRTNGQTGAIADPLSEKAAYMRAQRAAGPVAADKRVSYSRAVDVLADWLQRHSDMPSAASAVFAAQADQILRPALPERLRHT